MTSVVVGPRILAGLVRSSLQTLDEMDAGLGQRVRARLGDEMTEQIERTSRVGWLPVEVDVQLTAAFYAEAGALTARAALRRTFIEAFDSPMLSPMLAAGQRVFGSRVESLLRWAPRVWSLLYRDCGSMELVQGDPGKATLQLIELPPELRSCPEYVDGTAAMLAGFLDVVAREGDATVDTRRLVAGEVSFNLTWQQPG